MLTRNRQEIIRPRSGSSPCSTGRTWPRCRGSRPNSRLRCRAPTIAYARASGRLRAADPGWPHRTCRLVDSDDRLSARDRDGGAGHVTRQGIGQHHVCCRELRRLTRTLHRNLFAEAGHGLRGHGGRNERRADRTRCDRIRANPPLGKQLGQAGSEVLVCPLRSGRAKPSNSRESGEIEPANVFPAVDNSLDCARRVIVCYGTRAQYWEKIPNSTRWVTSTKPAASSAARISVGATQASMVSQ